MARTCTVCQHEDAVLINEALVIEGRSNRAITRQFGLSKDAVRRHREHIPELLVQASKAEEVAQADGLLERVEALQARTLAILEATEETQDHRTALAAIREARGNLELIGEVTKELNRTPQLNLEVHAEFLEVRALIVEALEPFPAARDAVLRALEAGTNGAVRLGG
jgi:hypothetical protein